MWNQYGHDASGRPAPSAPPSQPYAPPMGGVGVHTAPGMAPPAMAGFPMPGMVPMLPAAPGMMPYGVQQMPPTADAWAYANAAAVAAAASSARPAAAEPVKPTTSSSAPSRHPASASKPAPSSSSSGSRPAPTSSSSSSMTRIPDKRASMPPKKDWFLGKLKYRNTLPEIPFEPKSLSLSYDPARFTKFTPTSLEQTQKRELRSELMLGIPIDLVDVSALATKANASLDALAPEDRALMLSTVSESDPSRAARADRSSTAKVNVPFLRRSEYVAMSNNILGRPDDATYVERIRNPVRKLEYIAPEDQPALIEATFAAAKKDPVHPTKPSLTPVEVLPVFPDFDQWANRVVRVGFEAPPDLSKARAAVGMPDEELRGLQRENAFIVTKQHPMHKRQTLYYYCVPTEETLKRIAFDDDEDDQEEEKANEYEVVAEYMQFDRETKAQTFIFTLKQEEAVCYQEAPNRLRLQKRRRTDVDVPPPEKVLVTRRAASEEEKKEQAERLALLEA